MTQTSAEVTPPVLHFDNGIPGFGGAHRFALTDLTDDSVFQEMVSLDDNGLRLVVASPWLFFPDYAPDIPEIDRLWLGLERQEDAILFCAVVVEEEQLLMNLRAPFVAHATSLAARQVVLDDTELALRAPLLSAA